jgi:coenzyme F420 hydrogenase subunit beta
VLAEQRVHVHRRLADVFDVAERNLCTGCGACAYLAPREVAIVDDVDDGRRPVKIGEGPGARAALAACPGAQLAHDPTSFSPDVLPELLPLWGPVVQMWEGHASDPTLRAGASSGGAATALASDRLTQGAHGVLHVRAVAGEPWRNEPVLSRDAAGVVTGRGSRYAPASPAEGLAIVEAAPGPCVVIGKPCDIAAVRDAARLRPELAQRIDLTIAVFCAGTPSTAGTLEMLAAMGVRDLEDLRSLDYRGDGWPGDARAEFSTDGEPRVGTLSYEASWGAILQRHRPWRCKICPDHTGEFADVAVGDPWWRPTGDDPGRSLVVARTERGRAAVAAAVASGALVLEPAPSDRLPRSQPNLVQTRGAVWGRVQAMRLLGLPTPRYRDVPTFSAWWHHLDRAAKVRSLAGTVRRIRRDRLDRRRPVRPLAGPPDLPRTVPPTTPTA